MRRLTRTLVPSLAALAVAGGASAAQAVAAPPDLVPFMDTGSGGLSIGKWYVDTTIDPAGYSDGLYSARYHHPEQVANRITAGPFRITAGAPGGTDAAPTAVAVQQIEGGAPKNLTQVGLVGTAFGGGVYGWAISNVSSHVLTPSAGAPVPSALGPVCREDSAVFEGTPGAALFDPPTCSPLDRNATGFASGITPGYQDVIALSSANNAYFDITGVAPGTGSVTQTVDPANEIDELVETNNVQTEAIGIPGVLVLTVAAGTTTTTPVTIALSATVVRPEVPGRRLVNGLAPGDAGQPAPGPATGTPTFTLASSPANGAVTIDAATGAARYTARAGFTGSDSFTYYAEDSRGLRSANATVTIVVNPAASTQAPGPGTTPGGTTNPGGGTSGGRGTFTLSARQLLINQRIGQAAIRRLNAVEAKLDGRPVPTTTARRNAGAVTLSARQLLINQRIYQAGVRRAAALEARVEGRPAPSTAGNRSGGTVRLSLAQLVINQKIAQAAVRRANALQARVA